MSIRSKARRISLFIKATVLLAEIAFGLFILGCAYYLGGIEGLLLSFLLIPPLVSIPSQIAQFLDLIGNAPVEELRYQRWEQQLGEQQAREQGRYTVPTRR